MKETIQELHLAAQYLAAAGISFLKKAADDSHTNVGWDKKENRMITHPFGGDFQLSLNLNSAKLEWLKNGLLTLDLDLNSSSHQEVKNWIAEQAKNNGISSLYQYSFHYDLPYEDLKEDHSFSLDVEELNVISTELTKAQNAFEQFLESEKLESPMRIWPHHFDLGIYVKLEAENTFMGAGLAIPDSLVDDFYFYASAYKNGAGVETKNFEKKEIGEWRADWNGATLPSSSSESQTAIAFLVEAKQKFDQ